MPQNSIKSILHRAITIKLGLCFADGLNFKKEINRLHCILISTYQYFLQLRRPEVQNCEEIEKNLRVATNSET